MPIEISCACGKTLRVPDRLRGKKGRCPGCKAILDIPLEDAPPAEAALEESPAGDPPDAPPDAAAAESEAPPEEAPPDEAPAGEEPSADAEEEGDESAGEEDDGGQDEEADEEEGDAGEEEEAPAAPPPRRAPAPLARPAVPPRRPVAPVGRAAVPPPRPPAPPGRASAPLRRPSAPLARPAAPSARPGAPPARPAAGGRPVPARRPIGGGPRAVLPPPGRFSVGKVIGRTFSAWFGGFVTILALSLVTFLPLIGYTLLVTRGPMEQKQLLTWAVVSQLLQWLLGSLLQGAIAFTVYHKLRGAVPGIGRCLQVGLRRILSVVWVSILYALAIFGAIFLVMLPAMLIPPLAIVFMIAAVIAALMAMCSFWVCIPVVIVERASAMASLGRSRNLTRGSRWPVFFVILFMMVIHFGCGFVLQYGMQDSSPAAQMFAQLAVGVLTTSFQAVLVAVAYYELREAREGIGIEALARVFE